MFQWKESGLAFIRLNGWCKLHLVIMREDESIFHPNIIDYYQNILDSQEKINLAYFAAYYEYLKVKYYWIGIIKGIWVLISE